MDVVEVVPATVFLRNGQSGRSAGRAPRLNGGGNTLMVWLHVHQGLRDEVICHVDAEGVATLALEGQDRQYLGVSIPVVRPRLGAGYCVDQ
eukprot:610812-Lingulodinium_polyedra.AAC.1